MLQPEDNAGDFSPAAPSARETTVATESREGVAEATSAGRTAGATRVPPIEGVHEAHGAGLSQSPVAPSGTSSRQMAPTAGSALDRKDQVRWGPIWAGVTTALSTFIFLELAFFSLGWLTLGAERGPGQGGPTVLYVMTGLAGLLAFLLGGMVAGATAMWRGIGAGVVQGALVWTLGVSSILVLTLLGGGALFGALSDALGRITVIQNAVGQGGVAVGGQALLEAREATGWAVAALAAFFLASVLGGMLGAKIWPRERQDAVVDVRR